MFPWEGGHCRNPRLRPYRSFSDRLRIALSRSRLEDFWILLEKGTGINTRDLHKKTLLHLAIKWRKYLVTVNAVISTSANRNAIDYYGHASLHSAVHSNSGSALLITSSEIGKPHSHDTSPLMESINQNNNTPVNRALLTTGANFMIESAIKTNNYPEVIKLFTLAGYSVNDSSTAFPPISYAVLVGDPKVVRLLLAAGARIDFLYPESLCALLHKTHIAGVAQELIKHEMDLNAVDNHGETPLHKAVKNDLLDVAITLIKAGGDIHRLVERNGENCFHLARSRPMVKMLASHGVDINAHNMRGMTPLHSLVGFYYILSFSFLRRTDRYMHNHEVLYTEKINKCQAAVKEMLKYGADVNAIDAMGKTVLEIAAYLGNPKIILYMIKHGVQVCWGKLFSLNMIHKSVIKLLIRESLIRNINGKNIFDYFMGAPIQQSLDNWFLYALQCKSEIEIMKVEKINCNNTIHHYVVETAPNMKPLRLCSHYEVNHVKYTSQFPIYKNKISVRLNKCYKRAGMLDVLENIDVIAPTADGKEVVSLINDCKFAIAEFISNKELLSFLLAMGMKVSKDGVWPKSMNCGDKSPPINT